MSSRVLSSKHLTLQTRTLNATRDDKINDCGFKFSVACQWRVLIKEDEDNFIAIRQNSPRQILSYQFAKVLLHHRFVLYSMTDKANAVV